MAAQETIAFLGLGGMGTAMALNLLADGHQLKVWNRTPEKTEPLKAKGAQVAASPIDAVMPGGIVFSIVSDDRALEEICFGIDRRNDNNSRDVPVAEFREEYLAAINAKPTPPGANANKPFLAEKLGSGGIHISMSTIAPATAKKLADQHAQFGAAYIASPVFGRPSAVANRQIFICTSGPAAAKDRVRPILQKLGQGIYDFGEDPAAANVVKLAGNFMIAACTETLAEAAVLCEKSGVPAAGVLNFLTSTYFNSPAYKNYAKKILERSWAEVAFKLQLGSKDMNLVADLAKTSAVPMPILSLLRDRFLAAIAQGNSNRDWSIIAQLVRDDAGLD